MIVIRVNLSNTLEENKQVNMVLYILYYKSGVCYCVCYFFQTWARRAPDIPTTWGWGTDLSFYTSQFVWRFLNNSFSSCARETMSSLSRIKWSLDFSPLEKLPSSLPNIQQFFLMFFLIFNFPSFNQFSSQSVQCLLPVFCNHELLYKSGISE